MIIEYGLAVNVIIPDEEVDKLQSLSMKLEMMFRHIREEYPLPKGYYYYLSADNKLRIGEVWGEENEQQRS